MSKRNIYIIVSIIIIILLGLFLIFLYNKKWKKTAPQNKILNEEVSQEKEQSKILVLNKKQEKTEEKVQQEKLKAGVKAVAITFVERYGSFSNQSNFENLKDLRGLMTTKFQKQIDEYLANHKQTPAKEFYAVETKLLSLDFKKFDIKKGVAEIQAKTKRIEYFSSKLKRKEKIQRADIILLKQNDKWLVDSFKWL